MTEKEKKIIHLLEEIYEEYIDLDFQHKDDLKEFVNALHIIQHLVMIRSVRREYSDLFPIDKKTTAVINDDSLKDLFKINIKNEDE